MVKLLFGLQPKMLMRYLLILGASSIAMNRNLIVIAELESKLKKATAEQLSEAARQELIGVIKLLREQESAFSKQDRMSEEIKAHGAEIVGIKEVDKKQDKVFFLNVPIDEKLKKRLFFFASFV